jgi:hypothetical protein
MTLRDLLLLAYPRSWREEYGEELAAIVARRRLTPGIVADVIWNASKQHLDRDEPWMICGAGLALWLLALKLLTPWAPSRSFVLWYFFAGLVFVAAAGALSVTRSKLGVARATVRSVEAAALGQLGALVLFLFAVPQVGTSLYLGHTIYYWFGKTIALHLAISALFGFMGALLAWAIPRRRASPSPQSH